MIQGLIDETSLQLETICAIDKTTDTTKSERAPKSRSCSISIIVYGPLELFDEIGSWFQDCGIYLQDPVGAAKQDLKYCNPHRLSVRNFQSCSRISELVLPNSNTVNIEERKKELDFLDTSSNHSELEAAPQPSAIRSLLKK